MSAAADPAVQWHLPATLRERLVGPNGLRLPEWLKSGHAAVLKQAPHRTIYHVNLGDVDFHLKEYRTVGLQGVLRELARPVKARTEFQRSQLTELGVPVPKPLGWGVLGSRFMPQASFLLSETVKDAEPLLGRLDANLPPRVRQQWSAALGEFLARLHAAGVVHRDLHPGNILSRIKDDGDIELFLIDLHESRINKSWDARRENLAVFNRFFILRATRTDRLRFWQAYRECAGRDVPDHSSATPSALEEQTVRSNVVLWVDRDRRCVENNRYFRRFKKNGLRVYASKDLCPKDLEQLLAKPDAPFAAPGARLLKNGKSSAVVELNATVNGETTPVIWKRFTKVKFADAVKNATRPSAAMRSWVMGHGLLNAWLPTARPLAVAHQTKFGMPSGAYLLTAKLENVVDLRVFMESLMQFPIRERTPILRSRIAAVARLLRSFHQRRFIHRDLKSINLLTSSDWNDHRIWFIDLVGVRRCQRVNRACRVRDLSRLSASFHNHPGLSRSDKLRFLGCYMDWATRGNWGWKRWWRELANATNAKIERNAKTGRVLA